MNISEGFFLVCFLEFFSVAPPHSSSPVDLIVTKDILSSLGDFSETNNLLWGNIDEVLTSNCVPIAPDRIYHTD